MKDNISVDYLIIGQGIAGSLLAWFLSERGQKIHLIDNHYIGSSSVVAAGIINPVTGRRLVKSWMFDELLPIAKRTYQEIENKLAEHFYQERTIYRALSDVKAENTWDERSGDPGYEQYLSSEQPNEQVKKNMQAPFSWGAIHKAAQVDVPVFLDVIKEYFQNQNAITTSLFNSSELEFPAEGGIRYKHLKAKHIIFCEGQQARFNPWFKQLPFVVSKGEMLEIEIPGAADMPIIKHKSYITPLGQNRYWVGATYEWDELNESPTEKGKENLLKNLDRSINSPYRIIKQNAAIRPTVKDRRPFLGTHSEHSCLHIFNGLGTKGTSLGPYWGLHFVDHLLDGKDLVKEVDIRRFEKE
ncbi:MAG: glycine/D-amino acid oxidase-like deaminating enzyme [Polaribacter sp.]|jgi:glycine/D-amino acid oxidase-like deaminating enzyme